MHRVLVATLEALCCTRGGFSDGRAWAVECTGSVVVARGFRSSEACGISVLRQGMEPMSPPLEGRFLTPGPQGSSWITVCLTFWGPARVFSKAALLVYVEPAIREDFSFSTSSSYNCPSFWWIKGGVTEGSSGGLHQPFTSIPWSRWPQGGIATGSQEQTEARGSNTVRMLWEFVCFMLSLSTSFPASVGRGQTVKPPDAPGNTCLEGLLPWFPDS